jgi:hypothetical protein
VVGWVTGSAAGDDERSGKLGQPGSHHPGELRELLGRDVRRAGQPGFDSAESRLDNRAERGEVVRSWGRGQGRCPTSSSVLTQHTAPGPGGQKVALNGPEVTGFSLRQQPAQACGSPSAQSAGVAVDRPVDPAVRLGNVRPEPFPLRLVLTDLI